MTAYYNETDPFAAAWLRELIKRNLIAPGDVDTRSIEDVTPDDVAAYDQCHWFAGIGTWSYALRLAGWPDDRPVWTGSCPCQPFSAAGQRGGFDDERHLWPAWFWLISQSTPRVVFGEQVASRDGLTWLDLVCADLEGAGYAVGALDLCAAGFGAPHRRQRLFYVADAEHAIRRAERRQDGNTYGRNGHRRGGDLGGMADALPAGRAAWGASTRVRQITSSGGAIDLADPNPRRCGAQRRWGCLPGQIPGGRTDEPLPLAEPGPTNGFWRAADWLPCRDGKARPIGPGIAALVRSTKSRTAQVADGPAEGMGHRGSDSLPFDPDNTAEARVGQLRGYGNGIVAPQAAQFIRAYMELSSGR